METGTWKGAPSRIGPIGKQFDVIAAAWPGSGRHGNADIRCFYPTRVAAQIRFLLSLSVARSGAV